MARDNGNLRPVRTKEEARERGRRGGKASGIARAKRKTLKEELLLLLSEGDTQKSVTVALLQKAISGDVKAFEVIRDTIGEKPVEEVNQKQTVIDMSNFSTEDLKKVLDDDIS